MLVEHIVQSNIGLEHRIIQWWQLWEQMVFLDSEIIVTACDRIYYLLA